MVKRAKGGGSSQKTAVVNCLALEELNDLLDKLSLLYSLREANKKIKEKPDTVDTLKRLGFTDAEVRSPKALFRFRVVMLYPIVYLGARTGMRLSELLALKWKDVNFEKKEIRVYESSHYGKKGGSKVNPHHINCTKEGKPKSFIDISSKDVEFLKHHRKEQQKRRLRYRGKFTDNGLVFAKKDGTYLRNDTVSKEFTDFAGSNIFPLLFIA